MRPDTSNPNTLWAGAIAEALARRGVRLAVVSPGSRSAPLAIAFARHPGIDVVLHFDERAAAYFALGAARASGRPMAVICTSGTAVANLLPAAVEAFQSTVPLVLLTADRPRALVEAGANQTIYQEDLFGTHARWACTLPCPDAASDPAEAFHAADEAARHACGPPAGPAHLNCPFEEPLDPVAIDWDHDTALNRLNTGMREAESTRASSGQSEQYDGEPPAGPGCVIAGALGTDADRAAALGLASALSWPLLPDITSGLRLGRAGDPVVPHFDLALTLPAVSDAFRPETVIHLGGPWTSKRLLQHLGQHPPRRWMHIAPDGLRWNPLVRPVERVAVSVEEGCRRLTGCIQSSGRAAAPDLLAAASVSIGASLGRLDAGAPWSEPFIMRRILRTCGETLFLGNSLPIRLADTFGPADAPARAVFANRGASGIDGCVATAAGIARASGQPLTCILGDLAALHDLNAMALLRQARAPFRLVVLNNDGGGIFHFLPVARHPGLLDPLFTTPHGLSFGHAAALFGLEYRQACDWESLDAALAISPTEDAPLLIEARTDRDTTLRVWRETERYIRGR
jgi:2-succinyl-5-enolpyruvyl-6-hydroxy-3-cyclohexene-1-carboxylate synthase